MTVWTVVPSRLAAFVVSYRSSEIPVMRWIMASASLSDEVSINSDPGTLDRSRSSSRLCKLAVSSVRAIWSPAQQGRFLEFAKSHRMTAFFHVAAFTGARRGELLSLTWPMVDLDGGVVVIAGSASVVEGERIVGTTKGGRRRTVTIDPLTVWVLQAHRARQAEERLVVESDWPESDLVFRTAFGEPVYPDTPSQLLPKLIDAYNKQYPSTPLLRIRLHDLRHIHATTLLLAGVPVHMVAARLGHADPSVTLRVYAHVTQELTPAVAATFAGAVEAAIRGQSGVCN